jgi:hypothetical protein
MGAIVLLAGGGVGIYLGTQHPSRASHPIAAPLSVKVLRVQTIGLINFGPYDDGDQTAGDLDDHPLMLRVLGRGLEFVPIPRSELTAGVPLWTADQMADGTEIFIYIPTGQCLTEAHQGTRLELTHCNLGARQRWRAIHPSIVLGQPISQFAGAAGTCLTAGQGPGPARLATCGDARTKSQEIAFWWSA